jgi:signal transduction histidine kinase/ActR/RegA family two-component response regulator
MSGESIPPAATRPISARAALSELAELLDALRERLKDLPDASDAAAAADADGERARLADRDDHALALFQEILSIPSIGLPPGELFGLAMDRVSRLLAADRALLLVPDEATGRLHVRSGRGFRHEDMESVSLDPSQGLIGRVFREKRVLTGDGAPEPGASDPFSDRFPVRQAIAVPVRAEGEVVGVLYAGRRALGAPFTTTDVLLLLVIADRVGSALVHQRLLARRGDHLAHLRELRELADAQLAEREPREILARAADAGRRLAGVRGALAVAGSGLADLSAVAGAGLLGSVSSRQVRVTDALLAEGFAADAPLAVRDLRSRRGAPGLLDQEGFRAALLVPLRARGRVIGLLCLAETEPREFSSDEVESVETLAALIASALEMERRLREVRRALATASLEQAQRVEGERARVLAGFAAGLTRELNSIFAVLLGKSQLVLARAQDEALRDGLAALEEAAWRGTDLLQRLLGLAEADQPGTGAVDLAAIAQEALGLTARRAPAASGLPGHLELAVDLAPTPPVEGNATALREAVINLIHNAMEAMPAGGTLTVLTREAEDAAELIVADTGEGIALEIRPRIFDPFFTTRPGHRGLGLPVVEAAVLRAGGRIDVTSGPGATTVRVWLPAAGTRTRQAETAPVPEAAPEPAAAAAPEPSVRDERTAAVLIVEEEEGIRAAVLDALMAVGHRVEASDDAPAALARLAHGGIDVVVTDLALRDRSGLQLAVAIRQASPDTAVVLLTGWGRRLHADRLRESGVDVLLVKPVQPDRVRSAVAEALQRRRPA